MESIIVELRAGEGGEDSRYFITDMVEMYTLYSASIGASIQCL